MTHYKNTQHGTVPMIILTIALVTLIAVSLVKDVSNAKLPMAIVLVVLGLVFLIFRRLTIIIDDDNISSHYGLGLITRKMPIKDIDLNTIEEVQVPWYYGIGIRITPKGILHNVKPGNAIYIKSKSKLFFVGTDDYETIKSVLTKLKTT